MNKHWAPHYLARWLFSQKRYWITADGRMLQVAKMDSTHLLNTLLMLERVQHDIHDALGEDVQDTVLYAAMKKRLERYL